MFFRLNGFDLCYIDLDNSFFVSNAKIGLYVFICFKSLSVKTSDLKILQLKFFDDLYCFRLNW